MASKHLLCLLLFYLVIFSDCRRFFSLGGSRSSSSRRWFGLSSARKPSHNSGHQQHHLLSSSSIHDSRSGRNLLSNHASSSELHSRIISGSGSGSSKYPGTTGLSGSGSSGSYPLSPGLSGAGLESNKLHSSSGLTSTGSASSMYPGSSGLSGAGIESTHNKHSQSYSTNSAHPHYSSNTYSTKSVYGVGYSGNKPLGYDYKTYHAAPQHIYITQYQNSGSRFGDLLTGLTLYNLGRSNSRYHNHYYNDYYYRHRYTGETNSNPRPYEKPKDEAQCLLRVKEDGKTEELKIPCEIVSTFTEGSITSAVSTETQTECLFNYTVLNNTNTVSNGLANDSTVASNNYSVLPIIGKYMTFNTTMNSVTATNLTTIANTSTVSISNDILNSTTPPTLQQGGVSNINSTVSTAAKPSNETSPTSSVLQQVVVANNNTTIVVTTANPINASGNLSSPTTITTNVTVVNSTRCTTTTDPLSVKGPPINASNMECEVDIMTKVSRYTTKVDCNILMSYSKVPELPNPHMRKMGERNSAELFLLDTFLYASLLFFFMPNFL